MIKTYCDICGEEITTFDRLCQYKIKKLELGLPYSQMDEKAAKKATLEVTM